MNFFPGDVVLPQLLEWIRFHFPSKEIMAMKILAKKSINSEQENFDYWEAIFGCALHGKLEVVRALLMLHSKADHPAFISADDALKTMPSYNVCRGYSVKEFTVRWKQWQMNLSQSIDCKSFQIEPNLELLMKVKSQIIFKNEILSAKYIILCFLFSS